MAWFGCPMLRPADPSHRTPPSALARLAGKLKRRLTLSHLVPQFVHETDKLARRLEQLERENDRMRRALGRIEARQTACAPDGRAAEFQVYSQWGEDGYLRWLLERVPTPDKRFVEFGVESYREANTRFLLTDFGWSGLVLDGNDRQVEQIRRDRIFWLHDLKVETAFITRDTINDLFTRGGMTGDLGLMSVDVDGVDWHLWDALEVARPRVVVAEYNHLLGPTRSVTVPYRPDFDRRIAHHSLCYYGASLTALTKLADRKGYDLVGCGSAGLNCYFVRRDVRPACVPAVTPEEAFVAGQFCEWHDEAGERVKVSRDEMVRRVGEMPWREV